MKNEIEATAKTLSKHKIKQFSQEKLLVEKCVKYATLQVPFFCNKW